MISWIKGEIIDTWTQSKKFYVLINCQGLGYEVQILEPLKEDFDKNIVIFWLHQIKKEDSDLFFGFRDKEKRDFFRDLLQVKGIGPQIGMALLNKYELNQIFNSVINKDNSLFNSVPGIGQKMTERLFLELKNKIKVTEQMEEDFNIQINHEIREEIKHLIDDLDLALKSLSYSSKERKKTLDFILNKIDKANLSKQKLLSSFSFEILLKESLDFLERSQ